MSKEIGGICSICKEKYVGYPALSRVDNATKICPRCGITEALMVFYQNIKK